MLTVENWKENGLKVKRAALLFALSLVDKNTKANLKTTFGTAKQFKLVQMD